MSASADCVMCEGTGMTFYNGRRGPPCFLCGGSGMLSELTPKEPSERERIVTWLRDEAADVIGCMCGGEDFDRSIAEHCVWTIETVAGRIERGDHLLKQAKP